ncbi:MAG TPA: hypothetical protein VLG50_02955, partial [Candidatus Saccharimonadales bacterium]|nr:hypothetical protein [Candidatus Saccharimonadales bacterium]
MYKKIILFLLSFSVTTLYCAIHLVTNTADSGPGSLRQAIIDANADPGSPRIINFAIGAGVQTITPLTALPDLTASNILIDGSSQPGYAGIPLIVIDGTNAAFGFDGLTITAVNNCTIQDLVINNGFDNGIFIQGTAANNSVLGCYLGVDQTGTVASPNHVGVKVLATVGQLNTNTIIGASGHGNVASGNTGTAPFGIGIFLSGNLQDPIIQGNFVGTNRTGTAAIGNGQAGVIIATIPSSNALTCSGTFIGGPNAGDGNV